MVTNSQDLEDDSAPISSEKEADFCRIWRNRIDYAQKREKTFRKDGRRVVDLYEAKTPAQTPFAILYSNTEVLQPAIYNQRPIPQIIRRFLDADPLGKIAAEVGTRVDKYLIEAESEDYDNFDELMQVAVLNGLLVNRGIIRFKYEADVSNQGVENECVYGEAVKWDKFCHGHARTWKKVPWGAFEWDMDQTEVKSNFGEEFAAEMQFGETDADQNTKGGETAEELSGTKLAKIHEIWDKTTKKVFFLSPNLPDKVLKRVDDPLGLSGFFPIPKPLDFMRKVTTLVPTPLYIQYENQAKELNELTKRLKHVVQALKVRGFYNKTIEGIEKVLQADENTLEPVENMASMPEGMGMDKLIWLMPLNELAQVAQSLYQQRESCKQVIYEITGISDILRGSTVASETATAQNLKNQWGTLRLRKMQKEVMRYCRDCLRIMLEIAVAKFDPKTVSMMTGLQYPTAEQKRQAQVAVQHIQAQAAAQAQIQHQQAQIQAMQTGQQAPQPAPMQPPQIPPELQQILSSPTWEDILGLLKNQVLRSYRVDIETNSTIDADASQDKQDISELLNALSQWMNGLAPLVENGVMPMEVVKQMLLAVTRRYTFGSMLEDAINQMQPPQPPQDPAKEAAAQQAQAQIGAIQAQTELTKVKSAAEIQKLNTEMQQHTLETQNTQAIAAQQHQLDQANLGLKQQQLALAAEALQQRSEFQQKQHDLRLAKLDFQGQQTETNAAAKVGA